MLVVGGGGGGGTGSNGVHTAAGAGGGAGGVVYNTNVQLLSGEYTVQVGVGGSGAVLSSTSKGSNGADSQFGTWVALGGGAGGKRFNSDTGNDGGCGGGTVHSYGGGTGLQPGSASGGYGADGGNAELYASGGGGGAGGVGRYGSNEADGYGEGGVGLLVNIRGYEEYFAGGGGAGRGSSSNLLHTAGMGGLGGGGCGYSDVVLAHHPVVCETVESLKGEDGKGGGSRACSRCPRVDR